MTKARVTWKRRCKSVRNILFALDHTQKDSNIEDLASNKLSEKPEDQP